MSFINTFKKGINSLISYQSLMILMLFSLVIVQVFSNSAYGSSKKSTSSYSYFYPLGQFYYRAQNTSSGFYIHSRVENQEAVSLVISKKSLAGISPDSINKKDIVFEVNYEIEDIYFNTDDVVLISNNRNELKGFITNKRFLDTRFEGFSESIKSDSLFLVFKDKILVFDKQSGNFFSVPKPPGDLKAFEVINEKLKLIRIATKVASTGKENFVTWMINPMDLKTVNKDEAQTLVIDAVRVTDGKVLNIKKDSQGNSYIYTDSESNKMLLSIDAFKSIEGKYRNKNSVTTQYPIFKSISIPETVQSTQVSARSTDQGNQGKDQSSLNEGFDNSRVKLTGSFKTKQKIKIKAKDYQIYRDTLREFISSDVKGQPETIDAVLDISAMDIKNDNIRHEPELLWLMGMPGVGKDTTAESFIANHHLIKEAISSNQEMGYLKSRMGTEELNLKKEKLVRDHLFRVDKLSNEQKYHAVVGSGTGFVGSDDLAPIFVWLVQHSGGRYYLEKVQKNKKEGFEIRENLDWNPNHISLGENEFMPNDGVLFLNEFHDWAGKYKNEFAKEAIEKGIFQIPNPGAGLATIQVPVTIMIASNDGIELITAKDKNGKRIGPALTEEQMFEKWSRNHKNADKINKSISTPSPQNKDAGGVSIEFLDRIPKHRRVLMRPLTKSVLKEIIQKRLSGIQKSFLKKKSNGFPSFSFEISDKGIEFLSEYNVDAESGSRDAKARINELFVSTITDSIINNQISISDGDRLSIDINQNKDGTYSWIVNSVSVDNKSGYKNKSIFIKSSSKEKNSQEITDAEIDDLLQLETKLNSRVKGVDHIVARIVKDLRSSINSEKKDDSKKEQTKKLADVYGFFGVSSTGKTELAVSLHQELYKVKTKPLVIDFNQIKSMQDLKDKILGSRDHKNESVASDFMNNWDKSNGDMLVVFDEITNANSEVLKGLYDILREPVVDTFSDGVPRPMGRVKIILTGNAGEEWYKAIPKDIPEYEQYEAARQIYEKSVTDGQFLRKFMGGFFSEAFINRIKMDRMFFFGPHTYKTTRDLIQFRVIKAIREFSEKIKGKRTWDVQFLSSEDYKRTIQDIEDYGFKLWEQGASITHFVDNRLMTEIHDVLLVNKIPSRSKVAIVKVDNTQDKEKLNVNFELHVEGFDQVLPVKLQVDKPPMMIKKSDKMTILTAIHEAGHEVMSHLVKGHISKSDGVTILPGVAQINGEWIRYLGLSKSLTMEESIMDVNRVIDEIAILAAGEMAESITTKNAKIGSGIANDRQRATMIAKKAVIEWGIVPGIEMTASQGQDVDGYLLTLSAAKKAKIERAVDNLLKAGRDKAKKLLVANFDEFLIPVALHLARDGEISGEVMERFFRFKSYLKVTEEDTEEIEKRMKLFAKKLKAESEVTNKRELEFNSFVKTPSSIVDLTKIINMKKNKDKSLSDMSGGNSISLIDSGKDVSGFKNSLMARLNYFNDFFRSQIKGIFQKSSKQETLERLINLKNSNAKKQCLNMYKVGK